MSMKFTIAALNKPEKIGMMKGFAMKKAGCITSLCGLALAFYALSLVSRGIMHGFEEAMAIFGPLFARQHAYPGAFSLGLILFKITQQTLRVSRGPIITQRTLCVPRGPINQRRRHDGGLHYLFDRIPKIDPAALYPCTHPIIKEKRTHDLPPMRKQSCFHLSRNPYQD